MWEGGFLTWLTSPAMSVDLMVDRPPMPPATSRLPLSALPWVWAWATVASAAGAYGPRDLCLMLATTVAREGNHQPDVPWWLIPPLMPVRLGSMALGPVIYRIG